MVGAAIGVLVLVLGLLMFLRRRQSIAEFEESILSGSALDNYSETTDSQGTSASDTSFLSDFGTAGMGTMQADEVDPLAEAEVYLAYGRDEQAEEVLKEAARRNPERSEIKLKLLEIYKQRNDVKSFETIAEELYPAGDAGDPKLWGQVAAMGRQVSPGNPLFQDTAAGTDTEPQETGGSERDGGLDFDLDEDMPSAAQAPDAQPAQRQPAPDDDAGDRDRMAAAADDTGTAPESGRNEEELSFDLEPDLSGNTPMPEERADAGGGTLDLGDDFLEQASRSVDPASQPFPVPDEQADLDRELERLASERETPAPAATEAGESPSGVSAPAGGEDGDTPPREVDWDMADSGSATLDFPSSDNSDIDFDLNLDNDSTQQLSGDAESGDDRSRDTAAARDASTLADQGDGAASERGDGDTLLEFESENIPPQETWAGPSSDAAPASNEEEFTYEPEEDVQSAGAPQYDEADTKLDLARAYLDMGDKIGARSIIDEVMREGDPSQRDQAAALASQL